MKRVAILLGIVLALSSSSAHALSFTIYNNRAAFLADLWGAPDATQDFSGYANGTDMYGVPFMPGGVNVESWSTPLEIGPPLYDIKALYCDDQFERTSGNMEYYIHVNDHYQAFGFDIGGMLDNGASGGEPGDMAVWFSDGSYVFESVGQDGPDDARVFFGVIADQTIDVMIWKEPNPRVLGFDNDDTWLDDFVADNPDSDPIPEPGTVFLFSLGLAGVGAAYRRRRS